MKILKYILYLCSFINLTYVNSYKNNISNINNQTYNIQTYNIQTYNNTNENLYKKLYINILSNRQLKNKEKKNKKKDKETKDNHQSTKEIYNNTSINQINNTSTNIGNNTYINHNIQENTNENTLSSKNKIISNNNTLYFFDCYSFTRMNEYMLAIIYYSIIILYIICCIIMKKYDKYFTFLNKDILICKYSFKLGNLLFISTYILWWCTVLFYSFYKTNKSEIISRLGAWISLNLASVFLPITRNSFWVLLLDISYNDIILTHRVLGLLCFISIILKFIYCLAILPTSFFVILINQTTGGSPIFGIASTISFILCVFVSFYLIRKNCFEVFYYSHRILSSIGIITGTLHYASTFYYILPSILLYIIDIILRLYFMKSSIYSRIKNVGFNKTSSIFIEATLLKNIKTFPGCYFLLCFYNDISKYQWHPLSLISISNNTLSFCAKDNGINSWTNKLKTVINEYNVLLDTQIYIQGPYGTDFSKYYQNNKYNNILLFCGGIGITPLISILSDLDSKYKLKHLNNLENITFFWIVNNQYLIKSFEKYFTNLNDKVIINIFITGHDLEYADDINTTFYDKINIFYYKPSITSLLTKNLKLEKDNCIISCGSKEFIKVIQTYNYSMNKFKTDLYYESFT